MAFLLKALNNDFRSFPQAMAIPRDKVDEIQAAADIVEVAADYVDRLKKRGSNYMGLCPFHQEKTPSFSVDPDKNLFYCFGCQKGGNIFTLVQELEGVRFPEAARMLAERFGVPLPEEAGPSAEAASEVESIYHALRFAARFFYRQLTQTEQGQPALDYLKGRGFEPETIKRFGLGYAPDRWDALLEAAKEEHIAPEMLEKAGLVIERKSGDGYYDRYRGRVIFPLFSHVGKVLGFAGRILDGDSDQPKYINSPETRVYHKSKVLYGLHQAKQEIRRTEEALLVEGYTDVITLHQAGIEQAVASSGTALTREQVRTLSRYAERIILLYDADEAGGNAALRGIDRVLEEGLAAYAVQLPEGEDPDTYVREEGAEAFQKYLKKHRKDVAAFWKARAQRAGAFDTPDGKTKTMQQVMASIARIPNDIMRENHLRRASEVLGMYEEPLRKELERIRRKQQRRSSRHGERQAVRRTRVFEETNGAEEEPEAEAAAPAPKPLPPERILLRLMLERGTPMVEFILGRMAIEEFTEGPAREMAARLLEMYEEDAVEPERMLDGSCGPEVQNLAASVMVDREAPSENWMRRQNIPVPRLTDDPEASAASAMTLLKLERVNEAIEEAKETLFQIDGDDETLRAAQERLIELQQLRRSIERREFLDWEE